MSETKLTPKARAAAMVLHREAVVFDSLTLRYAVYEPYASRIHEAGVDVFNITIAAELDTWDETLRHIETLHENIAKLPIFAHATSYDEVMAAQRAGKTAVIFGTQGATMLEAKLWRLSILRRLGIRFFAPSQTGATLFADGCGERRDAGLSFLGRDLIALCDELGMIVDLSHCGHRTRLEAAKLAKHPVCTHSNAYALLPNDRNTKDETIREIAAKGGVIGVCGLPRSVAAENASLDDMLDHLDYFVKLVGHDHVGLGPDFTEGYQEEYKAGRETLVKAPKWRKLRPDIFGTEHDFYTAKYPRGFESVSLMPDFTQGLMDRGYSREQILSIMGGNWLRLLKEAEG